MQHDGNVGFKIKNKNDNRWERSEQRTTYMCITIAEYNEIYKIQNHN